MVSKSGYLLHVILQRLRGGATQSVPLKPLRFINTSTLSEFFVSESEGEES